MPVLVCVDARGRASVWRGRRRLAGPTRDLAVLFTALGPTPPPDLLRVVGWVCRPD